jgi:L-aspartate oxidase
MSIDVDYLVIGSGLAGLTFALTMAPHGSVAVLTKKNRTDANSSWAQGGIAGVISGDDSFELHKNDTLVAGAGLCNERAVEVLVTEGPERIRELIALGAQFNTEIDNAGQEVLSLGREGGHSRNRIVHTADYTGWECERTMLEAVRSTPNIVVYEHFFVTDLVTASTPEGPICLGAAAIHAGTGLAEVIYARATLLATGGCGHVYQHTTNPPVATGDGVAMAWRAGAAIANMEFIQFHPTTLYHPDARAFLITEALRGEGGILRDADGNRFMPNYHPLAELAPRDIVARAIVSEMRRLNAPCVYLDATQIDHELLRTHFPTVYERCLSVGIDITKVPIPIVPAQHYQCGGVLTDLDGTTPIQSLYAAGEVACTGVHGANRLASNSLLEAMVFGRRAANHVLTSCPSPHIDLQLSEVDYEGMDEPEPPTVDIATLGDRVKRIMQQHVGIVRSTAELEAAAEDLRGIVTTLLTSALATVEDWETLNIAQVGLLIVESALCRHESRGLHYIIDYPETLESERHDTVLIP